MKKVINYYSAGFTLIEMTIVMAIIAIIFSMAVAGANRLNSKSNVNSTAESLTSDLRSTVMSALNSEQFQLQAPANWGIQIDDSANPTRYTVFADLNSDGNYQTNEKFKTVVLSKNIRFSCTTFNGQCHTAGSITFNVSTAKTYFYATELVEVTNATGNISISLEDTVTSDVKNIVVNGIGAISPE